MASSGYSCQNGHCRPDLLWVYEVCHTVAYQACPHLYFISRQRFVTPLSQGINERLVELLTLV